MEFLMTFPSLIGNKSSQLAVTPSFFRGVGIPPAAVSIVSLDSQCGMTIAHGHGPWHSGKKWEKYHMGI
jgi:hypothetical protein